MSTTPRTLAEQIVAEQTSVYTNDAGQGSAGPGMIDIATLAELVESGEIDDYEIVDGPEAEEVIKATLDAHQHDRDDGTRWIVARRTADDGQSNPYRHYLLLWDTEQDNPAEPTRYEIDESAMGSEWQGDLDSFAEVLQDVAGDTWEIVPITDMYNGARNRDEDGNRIDIPEDVWLRALDIHARRHPEMWRCG